MKKEENIVTYDNIQNQKLDSYKSVLIVGSNHTDIPDDIKNLYAQPGYLLIGTGDGEAILGTLDLEVLRDRIGPETKINIWSHGNVIRGAHSMDRAYTRDFLARIATYSNNRPLHIHIHSCFAGAAATSVDVLPIGSVLVTHGENRTTLVEINSKTILQTDSDFCIPDPVIDFVTRLLLYVKQTATISIKRTHNNFHYAVRAPQEMLSSHDEIVRYFDAVLQDFIYSHQETFSDEAHKHSFIQLPKLTVKDAIEWKQDYFRYLANVDIKKLVEALQKTPNGFDECLDYQLGRGEYTASDAYEDIALFQIASYSLDPDQAKNSNFFKSQARGLAIKYIRQAYDKGNTDTERKNKAQEAFDRVKDFKNKYHIKAIVDYGLSPDQIKDAKCFDYSGNEAIAYISQAYDGSTDPNGRTVKAMEAFNQIKDFDSKYRIQALQTLVSYGLTYDQVKDAKCFNFAGKEAIAYIRQAYSKGSSDIKRQNKAIRAFERIKDFETADQIQAFLVYGLSRDQLKDAKCFAYYVSNWAIKYIRQSYVKGITKIDKRNNAQEAFNQIKDFNSKYRIQALQTLISYGLTYDQVKDAKCFGLFAGKEAIAYIKQAYDSGIDLDDKAVKAQEIFNYIKDFENGYHIEAVIEYGLSYNQVKDAKCWSAGTIVIAYIKEAYGSGTDPANKIVKAQEAFDKIKDFEDDYRIQAFVYYGLTRDQTKDAKCFGRVVGDKAIAYIKQAYDSGIDLDDKAVKAQEAFSQIKDFYSMQRINVVLDYGLNPDQVKDAECFGWDIADQAIAYIKQYYDSGSDQNDKRTKAQEAFKQIKDFDSKYRIQAITDYSLNTNQVKNAKCFDWSWIGDNVVNYIKQAYDSGTDLNNKAAKAQDAFNKIKDFGSAYRVQAFINYGLNRDQVKDAKCLEWGPGDKAIAYIKRAYDTGADQDDKEAKAQEAFDQIKDFESQYYIAAVLDYRIPLEQARGAKCFNWNAGDKAIAHIKQAYDTGADQDDKEAKAQEAFDQIKDFESQYYIAAVLDYRIPLEQARGAKCFNWNAGDKAIAYIKQAYDTGADPDDKAAKVQEAFGQIKDFESQYHIEAVVDYRITPEQARDAKCFNWSAGDKAIAYIKQAYDTGADPDDKAAKAQEAFDQIKNLNVHSFKAIMEYGLDPALVAGAKWLDWDTGYRVIEYIKLAYDSGANLEDKIVKAQVAFSQIHGQTNDDSQYKYNMVCITPNQEMQVYGTAAAINTLINHVSKLEDEYIGHHTDHNFVQLIALMDSYMDIDRDAVHTFISMHIDLDYMQEFSTHLNNYHVEHYSFEMGSIVTNLIEHGHA